jgi:transmembrane sensor
LLIMLNKPVHPVKTGAFVGQTMPSDDIRLISGKNVLILGQDAQIALNKEGKVSLINKKKESEIVLSKDEMNRLIVPCGKRSMLQLADGTKVWMNSGTELEFPSEFKGSTRDIVLKGEIYIEVAKMEDKPFYVHTPEFTVQVLGTRFNVSAYPDNSEKTIVLVEGAVEVSTIGQGKGKLGPDEMLTINQDGLKKQKADVSRYICWKDGVLILNKTPISDVLQKIGRYYNVSFDDYSDELLSSKTCTGKLYLSENLDEVLMSVAILSKTEYHTRDSIIYIRNKLN